MHTLSKKFVYKKNSKPVIGGRNSSFQLELGKVDPRLEILSVVKGHAIQFSKVTLQRTIPKQLTVSKTQELLIDQEIFF